MIQVLRTLETEVRGQEGKSIQPPMAIRRPEPVSGQVSQEEGRASWGQA